MVCGLIYCENIKLSENRDSGRRKFRDAEQTTSPGGPLNNETLQAKNTRKKVREKMI